MIDLKPGAGGMIGAQHVVRAAPDGHTLLVASSSLTTGAAINKKLPFDVTRDLAPVTVMTKRTLLLISHPALPVKNAAEYIALVRQRPGQINFGSIGNGSATHLAAELLKQMTGTAISNVPFKDSLEMHRAVAGGDVSFSFDSYASPKGLIEAGRLRAIAVTSRERPASVPAIPAIAESVAGFELESWTGLATPTGVPAEAHARLTSELRAIMQSAEWKQLMTNNGVEAGGGTPEDFSRRIAADFEKFGRVLQAAGLKPES